MLAIGKTAENRDCPREIVRWGARWRAPIGHESLQTPIAGEILDISPAGAFLRPTVGVPPTLTRGLGITLEFRVPGRVEPVLASGFVRWVGTNSAHGCFGCGIEFERPFDTLQPDIASKL